MTPDRLMNFRERLHREAEELQTADRETEADRAPVELDQTSVGRLSRMDAMQQQAMATASRRRRMARLTMIDAALARMAEDEYGWCLDCGEAIAEARLDLDPATPLCIECASR